MALTENNLPDCPVAITVQIIGSKWKLLILRNLMERSYRFNELKKDIPGISQKMLTESLRALERYGIVNRRVIPDGRRYVEYSLSDFGETLRPILGEMAKWGEYYKNSFN